MLIICPKCFAKYEVNEHLLNGNVQVFQCTECQHRFEEHLELPSHNSPKTVAEMPSEFSSVVSDAVHNAAHGGGVIPSSKDFIAERTTVLPEAFTPIESETGQKGRKVLLVVFVLLFASMVFGGVYFWVAKDVLVKRYPGLHQIVQSVKDKPAQTVPTESELPMEDDGEDVVSVEAVQVPTDPINNVIDLTVQEAAQVPERILPVETDSIAPVSSEKPSSLQEAASGVLHVANDVSVQLQDTSEKTLDSEVLSVQSNPENQSDGMPIEVDVNSSEATEASEKVLSDESADAIIEDVLMPVDVSGEVVAVQIRDVTFKNDTTDKTLSRMFVQGMVENASGLTGVIPPLQAQLYDKDNVLLAVRDLPYAPTMIQPKSPEFFFYELSDVPTGSVAKVTVIVKGQ